MVDGKIVSSKIKSGSINRLNRRNYLTTVFDIPMMGVENYNKIGVLSSRYEAGKISETQEVYREAIVGMHIVEAMTYNKMGVPSSINGAW